MSIQMEFKDGSIGTVHYLGNGPKSFPKERLEVFADGGVLQLDNFRVLTGYGWKGFSKMKLFSQDKGHNQCMAHFIQAVEKGEAMPIAISELLEVSRKTIEAARSV